MTDTNMSSLLKHHSLNYIEMALSTHHIERIEHPDGYGKRVGDCGDTIEFFLIKKNNTLKTVSFSIQGCMNTIACANAIVRYTQGKSINHAWDISPDMIYDYLQTLPKDHYHCAELAVGALYLALKDL